MSETWADLPSLLDTRDRLLTARIGSLRVGRHSTRDQLRAAALEIAAALVLPHPEAAPDPIAEVSRQIKAMLGDVPLARHVEASESWRRLLRSLDTSIGPRGERLSLVDPLGRSWTRASFVGFVAGLVISAGAPFRAITRRGVLPRTTERRIDEAVGLLRVGASPQSAARATRISLATLYSHLHSRGLTTPVRARVERRRPTSGPARRAPRDEVVTLRGQGLTFAAIGARLGITRQRAHQLYRKAGGSASKGDD